MFLEQGLPKPVFVNEVLLEQSHTHSSIIYGYFYTIKAEVRDHMAYKPKIFTVWYFYRKGLPAIRNNH